MTKPADYRTESALGMKNKLISDLESLVFFNAVECIPWCISIFKYCTGVIRSTPLTP